MGGLSRIAEFIGYYFIQAGRFKSNIRPHLAGLILRSIEESRLDRDRRNLADMFLREVYNECNGGVVGPLEASPATL